MYVHVCYKTMDNSTVWVDAKMNPHFGHDDIVYALILHISLCLYYKIWMNPKNFLTAVCLYSDILIYHCAYDMIFSSEFILMG